MRSRKAFSSLIEVPSGRVISAVCCVEIRIVSIATGTSFSYTTLTWVLPSGSR